MDLEWYKPSEWCQCAEEGWRFIHCYSGWTLLQYPDKFKNCHENWDSETFPYVALEGGWKKEENGLMVKLYLLCCIFDENESEEFQTFLEMVDALAKPEVDKGNGF